MSRVAQEKINKLINEKNNALIEQIITIRRRATTLKQGINAGSVFMREASAAENALNLRLNEMKSVTANMVPVPPLDQSELEAKGRLQTQLTQIAEDNLQSSGKFREQGIEQSITDVLAKFSAISGKSSRRNSRGTKCSTALSSASVMSASGEACRRLMSISFWSR